MASYRYLLRCNTAAPPGVEIIETRTIIAYGLILLMVAAAIAAIAVKRYNNHERKIARRRVREKALWDQRDDAPSGPD